MAELELLKEYLTGAVQKLDNEVQGKVAPLDRMKKLLTAKDKKAMLLEMAGQCPLSYVLRGASYSLCLNEAVSSTKVATGLMRCLHLCREQRDRQVTHRSAAAEH